MRGGKLKDKIIIEYQKKKPDNIGQIIIEWDLLVSTWAEIRSITGREYLSSSKEVSENTYKIVIRKSKPIDSTMRILHGEDIYHIKAVLYHQKYIELLCSRLD